MESPSMSSTPIPAVPPATNCSGLLPGLHGHLALRVHPFWHHLLHLVALSLLGLVALLLLDCSPHRHELLDLLFMSVSASTVSGLNTVELESFSVSQVMVLTFLMLAGGEVFLSLLTLVFRSATKKPKLRQQARVDALDPETALDLDRIDSAIELALAIRHRCISALVNVVLVYLLAFHVLGFVAIAFYLLHATPARSVLKAKGLPLLPFAISVTVSSFANGGIIPTNENMAIFIGNSGLLLVIVVLVLVGNTMFSSLLRAVVHVLYRATGREEYGYMLRNPEKLGFIHLQSKRRTLMAAGSVWGLWLLQLVVFLAMEWDKGYLDGLSPFQRVVSGVFQATNSRHCGESSIDVSQVSALVSAIILVAMFLPVYASFQPLETSGEDRRDREQVKSSWQWLKIASMPQALYVAIFVILVCIIERKSMSNDPLNNSFLFVVFEVVSAYGNVGFSTGYACSRQLHSNSSCKDLSISLTGKWSSTGKLMIIFIMLFGRLKKFHLRGGKSWRLQQSS